MIEKTKLKNKMASVRKLPCNYCMNYMLSDIEDGTLNMQDDKLELLRYFNNIKDPNVVKNLLELLKDLNG